MLALVLAGSVAHATCGGFDGRVGRYDWCVDGVWVGSTAVAATLSATLLDPPVQRRLVFGDRSLEPVARLSSRVARQTNWLSPAGVLAGTGWPFTVGAAAASVAVAGTADRPDFDVSGGVAGGIAAAQAVGLTVLTTQVLQSVVGRPRPYTSVAFEAAAPELYTPLHAVPHAYRSLPDAHVATTAAALFTPATLWSIAELRRAGSSGPSVRWAGPAAALGVAVGVTAGVGAMRVRAGLHHRDDVYAGALVGATLGIAVPIAHALPARTLNARRVPTLRLGDRRTPVQVVGRL